MSNYLVHSSAYRARLRAPSLENARFRAQISAAIRNEPGVENVEEGSQSILLLLNGCADIKAICEHINAQFPAINDASPRTFDKPDARKCWLRTLLTLGISTVTLAAIGRHKAHAWVGGGFALLATHHVWERRKRI